MLQLELPPGLEAYVRSKVADGVYATPEDVVVGAVMQMQSLEMEAPYTLEELRAEIQKGADAAERGDFVEYSAEKMKAAVRQALAR